MVTDRLDLLIVLLLALSGAVGAFCLAMLPAGRLRPRAFERLRRALDSLHSGVDLSPAAAPGLLGTLVRLSRLMERCGPFSWLLDRLMTPGRVDSTHKTLSASGLADKLTPRDLVGARLAGGLCGLAIVMAARGGVTAQSLLLGVAVSGIAARLSMMPVTNMRQTRQARIRGSLAKAVDILVVAVEAGLTLDKAIQLYQERFRGPLAEELRTVQEDIRVGHRRRDAFRNAMRRVDVDELTRLLNAILIAERFGVPVAMVLRGQSQELKTRRSQAIQEQSMKAPIKMLLPVVGLIMPALFIILLGPMAVVLATGGLF
jgi:tight adherence protein C